MASRMTKYRALVGPVAVIALFLAGTRWSPFEPHRPPAEGIGIEGDVSWTDDDWSVLEGALRYVEAEGLATLPIGSLMGRIGERFVGTPYAPGTLEVEGPERLVVELRRMDCVTFVESVFALALLAKSGAADRLDDRSAVEDEYERALRALRYRNGVVDGYPSRLHYFTDWIRDNERKSLLDDVTARLGGVPDGEPVDFMSRHPESYRQLVDPANLAEIRRTESVLSSRPRVFVPEARIDSAAEGIRDGDIIAATSTVPGLDVAHTGLALWVDGTLRLLHAPLVGEAVQVSEASLAARIRSLDGQDGIIVARPREPVFGELASPGGASSEPASSTGAAHPDGGS